jgi:hypothetical protein
VTGSSWSARQEFGMPPHQQASQSRMKVSLALTSSFLIQVSQPQHLLERSARSCLIWKTIRRYSSRPRHRRLTMLTQVKSIQALPLRPSFRRAQNHYRTLLTILRKETPDVQADPCLGTNRPCASIRPMLLRRTTCTFVQISYSCLTSPPGSVPISWQED